MSGPTHIDIMEQLAKGSERFEKIDEQLQAIADALKPLPEMQRDIASTREIVEAWDAVKALGKFLKWAGAIAAAVSAIIVAVRVGASSIGR